MARIKISEDDKVYLLEFCIDWQARNNRQLSRKFISQYTEISTQKLLRLMGKKTYLRDILNFDFSKMTLAEICEKTNLSKKTVQNFCKKMGLKYKGNMNYRNTRFIKQLDTKKLTVPQIAKLVKSSKEAVSSYLRRHKLPYKKIN